MRGPDRVKLYVDWIRSKLQYSTRQCREAFRLVSEANGSVDGLSSLDPDMLARERARMEGFGVTDCRPDALDMRDTIALCKEICKAIEDRR